LNESSKSVLENDWIVQLTNSRIVGNSVDWIWLGLKLARKDQVVVVKEVTVQAPETFTLNQAKLGDLGITPRELEILQLIPCSFKICSSCLVLESERSNLFTADVPGVGIETIVQVQRVGRIPRFGSVGILAHGMEG